MRFDMDDSIPIRKTLTVRRGVARCWEVKVCRSAMFCPRDVQYVSTATVTGEYAHKFRNWRFRITAPVNKNHDEILCRCHKKPRLKFVRERRSWDSRAVRKQH